MAVLRCLKCGEDSGTSLVCGNCRKFLTDHEKGKFMRLWHDCIVAQTWDEKKGKGKCFHCGNWFPRDMLCGDHWPRTKGSAPQLRLDVLSGVPSCSGCNVSGAPTRKPDPMKKTESKPKSGKNLCSKCHLLLA